MPCSRALRAVADSSRDLPIPGSPRSTSAWPRVATSSNTDLRRLCSWSRPTNGGAWSPDVPAMALLSSHSNAQGSVRSSDDYGHLANDSHEHEVALLEALALKRAVDAAWTWHPRHVKPLSVRTSRPRTRRPPPWRLGERRASSLSPRQATKELISRNFLKPSRGLEPRTPSPWAWFVAQ